MLPGAIVIFGLALVYALYGDLPLVNALFLGVKAAVIVIVVEALLRVAKRALHLPVFRRLAVSAPRLAGWRSGYCRWRRSVSSAAAVC